MDVEKARSSANSSLPGQPERSISNLLGVAFIEGEDRVWNPKRSHWHLPDFLLGTRKGQCVGLFFIFVTLIIAGAVTWRLTGGHEELYDTTWYQSLWFSWGVFFDPGTQMGFPADSTVKVKAVAVVFSVLGFLYNLLILGLIVEVARQGLDTVHRQRNRLVANGHSLVLGWSEKTLFVLREMMAAAKNRGEAGKIVILAEEDTQSVWAEIRRHFPRKSEWGRFVCRKGCPYARADLVKASAKSAREIVVLGTKQRAREFDLDAVRCIVALASLPEAPSGTIITEVRSPETACVVSSILDGAEGMLARDPVNRIMALVALEPIVGDCFVSLVSFVHGEELYCKALRELPGALPRCRTFGEACRALELGVCVGVNPPDGFTILSPPDDYQIGPDDRLVVMAHSEAELTARKDFAHRFLRRRGSHSLDDEDSHTLLTKAGAMGPARKLVVVGWTMEMMERLMALDQYAPQGLEVHLLCTLSVKERNARMEATAPGVVLENLKLVHYVGSTTSVRKLSHLPLREAAAVLVLADLNDEDAAESDAACLGCAVTVHRLVEGLDERHPECRSSARVVCEVLHPRTDRVLMRGGPLTQTAQFFHSSALEAGIFAVAANDPAVFNTLLRVLTPSEPGRIAAEPVENYLTRSDGSRVDFGVFWQLWESVRAHDEVLLGWHLVKQGQTVLNPDKSARTGLVVGDKLVVLRSEVGAL